LFRQKRKVELAGLTPVKALRSGAVVIMRTAADDAAWVAKYQAAAERLKLREAATQMGASAQEVTGSGSVVRGSGPAEAVPGDVGLEVPGTGGSEPGSTTMTQATVEAEGDTFVRDTGRVDAEKSKEVVEVPPEAGQEVAQSEEPQPQQDRPMKPVVEAEWGAVMPPPIVQVVVPVVEASAPPQGSTPALINLTLNDSSADKGK
jgi:hypothetical protein